MKKFTNLLVAVEADTDGQLAAGSKPAVQQALGLAVTHGARLTFAHVIDMTGPVGAVLGLQPQSVAGQRQRQIKGLLEQLVETALAQGVTAQGRMLFGQDWRELIHAVLEEGHDLLLAGTRGRGVAGRVLFGSTCNRLLRYCPCPVWTVKAELSASRRGILVADDLTEVGQAALAAGASLAQQLQAELHVLHVLELPEDNHFLGSVRADELARRHAEAHAQLARNLQTLGGDLPASIKIVEGSPHAEILDYLQRHPIDLLCMGTVARSGLLGLITGNTAENVLPWIRCSVLAVKPEGFVSPVRLPESATHSPRDHARTS